MVLLDKEFLENEIKKAEAAIKACKEGVEINSIVMDAFRRELKKCTSIS